MSLLGLLLTTKKIHIFLIQCDVFSCKATRLSFAFKTWALFANHWNDGNLEIISLEWCQRMHSQV
jgi:hypothetical protein